MSSSTLVVIALALVTLGYSSYVLWRIYISVCFTRKQKLVQTLIVIFFSLFGAWFIYAMYYSDDELPLKIAHRKNRVQRLGAVSCAASVFAALVYAGLASSREAHLEWIFVLFGVAILGLLSGIAGLISSRGGGRIPVLSIVGCILNLPTVGIGLMLVTVIFGQQH